MHRFYRSSLTLIKNGWAWMLDYIYVAFWQTVGFFVRTNPKKYASRTKEQAGEKIPIILIPGIYENWQFMKPVADMLFQKGHSIHVVHDLRYNLGDVAAMSELVHAYIQKQKLSKCIIVAHSKGGLIGKHLLATYNQNQTVKGMVALHTPFSGSRYAHLIPLKSTRVFIPNSEILAQLALHTLENGRIVSIYGLFDPHIPEGSYLEGAYNIQLPTRGHFRIMNNTVVHEAIIKGIKVLAN